MLFQYVRGPDGHGAFTYASEAMRRLYGLVPAQLRESDQAWLDRIHPEDRERVAAVLHGLPPAEAPWRERFRVDDADGAPRWHALQAMPSIGDDARVLWHGYVDDITEQLAMEQAAREKEAAESASRAKSDFLARASHELRTPLNAILGFAQLMEIEGGTLDGDQKRQLSLIGASGRELLRLVDDMLDIARIEADRAALQPELLPLAPLLEQALQSVRPLAQMHGIGLQLIEAPAALHVRADGRRLLQVLGHLLSNAILYNRPGGHAWLAARADGETRVVIEVSDDGVGLNEQQQAALFQPFNRLGAERGGIKGLGLGLTLVQRLLPLMDGSIGVSSAPGRGSVFTVGLPGQLLDWASDAAAAAALSGMPLEVPAPAAAGAVPLPAATHEVDVLYVEDNPVNALLMQTLFQMRPQWRLKVAVDGGSGIEEALRAPPRLLLVDMHLPDMNGIDLLAELRRHEALREVPAIVVSAAAMSSDIEAARAAGFAAYWTKPVDLPRMLAELDGLLG
jgi:PAS domain S-box-containing protein